MKLWHALLPAVCLVATLGGWFAYHSIHKDAATASCVAGPGELCPTAEFTQVYLEMKSLNDDVAHAKDHGSYSEWQHKQWELMGMSMDLNRAVPSGYRWDDTKMKFISNAPPAPAAPAPAPTAPPPSPAHK
jgi:hypothetical protein